MYVSLQGADDVPAPIRTKKIFSLLENILACLSSVHNLISLSHHEQAFWMRLRFERYFSHHWATYLLMTWYTYYIIKFFRINLFLNRTFTSFYFFSWIKETINKVKVSVANSEEILCKAYVALLFKLRLFWCLYCWL